MHTTTASTRTTQDPGVPSRWVTPERMAHLAAATRAGAALDRGNRAAMRHWDSVAHVLLLAWQRRHLLEEA